jgi:hypothetical protein
MYFIGSIKASGAAAFVVALAFLGGVVGIIAGASQQAILEAVIAGMLTLISALMMYLLSKESLASWRPVIPYAMIMLLINTFLGVNIGGAYKTQYLDFEAAYNRRLLLYEKVELEVCKEKRLMELRGQLLPEGYTYKPCPGKEMFEVRN